MKKARVITTLNCSRSCSGCCNKYRTIMSCAKKVSIEDIAGFDEVIITGGEPMLFPKSTLECVKTLRKQNPLSKVYLYTASYYRSPDYMEVMLHVDGVHYTIHAPVNVFDLVNFQLFQGEVCAILGKSFRLYVDNKVDKPIAVNCSLWSRVESKPWLTEEQLLHNTPNGLPLDEELFILSGNEGTMYD